MTRYSVEQRAKTFFKGYGYLSFARILFSKCRNQELDTAAKTGLDALEIASRKLVHKAAEATDEFIRIKITGKIVKPKLLPAENSRTVKKIIISHGKAKKILNELRKVL